MAKISAPTPNEPQEDRNKPMSGLNAMIRILIIPALIFIAIAILKKYL